MQSSDAYIKRNATAWTLGTASVERVVALENGSLLQKSFRDRLSGRELIPPGVRSEVLLGEWALAASKTRKLKQGELQLDISLRQGSLLATKTYVVYPGSSIIREWVTFTNEGTQSVRVEDPGFLNLTVSPGDKLDFHWMTGGENQPGCWTLRTETLSPGKPRRFDSYDPFPVENARFPGDGVNAKILLNDRQVWPEEGWQYVPNATVTAPFDVNLDVRAGDRLVFLVNMHENIGWDTTAFDPVIAYEDGETHTASREFSGEQGKSGWQYQYLEDGRFVDLVYYPNHDQWRKEQDNASGTPFVGPGSQHPDVGQDAARVWTVPKSGRIRVTGSICNTGNTTGGNPDYGFRPGTSSYAPWYALYGRDTGEGVFIGWDYFGHWASSFALEDGAVKTQLKVAGFKRDLAPGESVSTPKAFVGVFRHDLDNAGNECLDWQYRYMWDYTRDGWFPAVRMLGYWYKGTGWGKPGIGWTGGSPDLESTFRKVFRMADLMRYTGTDVYHRDWGWWDRAGDWNGPDFRTTGDYLRKHGMGQLIYAFLYTVAPESKVAREHPDWVLGGSTLDMSRPEVVKFIKGQLDWFVERWGDFEWRNDSFFTHPRDGDDTAMLEQDEGFREILRSFLDKHPGCAFQAVNGGGNYASYDYVRYCSTIQFTDGAAGMLGNYWASLLFPPDKTNHMPDIWDPNQFDKATWNTLLCANFDTTGDTWVPAKLEGLRMLTDIYHYLLKQGVVGRWVRVYRPVVLGDDPTMYLQRLSGDGLRGIVIIKRPASGPVTIKPKGLLPDEAYTVSFQESDRIEKRTGRDLLTAGILLESTPPGELIYLNLPLHPGSKLDADPPGPPSSVRKQAAENMGYPGVELTWKPGSDDNWVSYYEVFRGGMPLDKVAKGTYYFDHSAGADPSAAYEVRTVDGAGNASDRAAARGPSGKPALVVDDTEMRFTGDWRHQTDLQPAHDGTISVSNQQGASVEMTFQGGRVLWFSKLGADCGKAEVSIDGGPSEAVDTYSADDIWGVCVYRKELPPGRHTIRITVTGTHGPLATDSFVYVDGLRVEH